VGIINGLPVAGSTSYRRKRPVKKCEKCRNSEELDVNNLCTVCGGKAEVECGFDDAEMKVSTYWFPWTLLAVKEMLEAVRFRLCLDRGSLLLYGEVYGGSIQSLVYGIPKGKGLGFRAFGLRVNGKFLDWDAFVVLCAQYGVETVPVVYRGLFSIALAKQHADGKTVVTNDGQIREGIVAYVPQERDDPRVGRVVLKFIGTEYELSKHKDKDTTDV
jgi:hypothetical protein